MIRRALMILLLLALAGPAVYLRRPDPVVDIGNIQDVAIPRHRTCIGTFERGADGSVQIGSVVRGPVAAALTAGLGSTERITAEIDDAGGAQFSLDELGAAGGVGILVELPSTESAAGISGTGAGGMWAAACTEPSVDRLFMSGGSTGTGETLDLVISNPYAQDAVVRVTGASEVGIDSASTLEEVIVPAGTTISRSLDAELNLRQSLTTHLEVLRGAIHAAYIQRVEGDTAIIEAVAPAADWWVPVIGIEETTNQRIVIASDSPQELSVQVDGYSPEGVDEAMMDFVLEPLAQMEIALEDLGGGPLGLRVSADGPIGVTLVASGEGSRSGTPAVPAIATDWMIPGSGAIGGAVWVTNPSDVPAEMVLQPLAPDTPARAATVEPGATVRVAIDRLGSGYLVRSSSPIAMLWAARSEMGRVLATPISIDAGDR